MLNTVYAQSIFVLLIAYRWSFHIGLISSRLLHSRSLHHMTLIGTTSELVSLVFTLTNMHYWWSKTNFFLLIISLKRIIILASMARKIYLRGGLGVGAFQRIYGGRKRNGSAPPHFCKSSGGVARHILQQLQTMNIVDLDVKGYVLLVLTILFSFEMFWCFFFVIKHCLFSFKQFWLFPSVGGRLHRMEEEILIKLQEE